MLFHFIRLHWRAVLTVIFLAVAVWFFLPAGLRAKLSGGWKKFGHAIGNFNARVLLTLLYAIVIMPFGLAGALLRRLDAHQEAAGSWFDHPPLPNTLEEARRQG